MTAKKVLFWVTLLLIILISLSGTSTLLQALPFMAIEGILIAEIWGKSNLQIPALVLSVIYLFINIGVASLVDIIFWATVIGIFSIKSFNK